MSHRNSLLAKIHIAKKERGLDDDAYRDFLSGVTGQRSAKNLNETQLTLVVDRFKKDGWKPKAKTATFARQPASSPVAKKMRALWLALYDLGIVQDNSESALVSYAKRITGGKDKGIVALQWVKGRDAYKVIEALKAWAVRDGGVDWSEFSEHSRWRDLEASKVRVVEAQWRILLTLGVIQHPKHVTVEDYGYRVVGKQAFQFYEDADFDDLQKALGNMIRKAKKKGD